MTWELLRLAMVPRMVAKSPVALGALASSAAPTAAWVGVCAGPRSRRSVRSGRRCWRRKSVGCRKVSVVVEVNWPLTPLPAVIRGRSCAARRRRVAPRRWSEPPLQRGLCWKITILKCRCRPD